MASVSVVKRKNGYAYKLQVKVKNQLTGRTDIKARYWAPPNQRTSDKQMKANKREAERLAEEYEEEVKTVYSSFNPHGTLSPDSTFAECAAAWLEKIQRQSSANHYEGCRERIDKCMPIAQIKLRKLSQAVIQNFFDWIDRRERVTYTVRSKPDAVRDIMKRKGERYTTLTTNHQLNSSTICAVLNGRTNVSYDYAKKFAEMLGADINVLFDVKQKIEPYAYNSNQNLKTTVRSILAFAKKRRLVVDNYSKAEYIDYPKRTQKEIQCMDENQVKQAYKAIMVCDNIRYGTALLTLIMTGLRRGELVGLKWENIDLDNRRITINKSVSRVKGHGVVEKDPKTDRSKRTIEIPNVLCEQLKRYKQWYFSEKSHKGGEWGDSGYLFINADTGKRIAPDTVISWVNNITEKAGLGYWSVHSMRHTNITMKLMNNVPLLEVAGGAGHSRTSTTTDKYGHYLKTHKNVAPQMFDSIMAPIASTYPS